MTEETKTKRSGVLPIAIGALGVVMAAAALVLAIKADMVIRDQQEQINAMDNSSVDALTEIINDQQTQLDDLAAEVAGLTELVESLDSAADWLYFDTTADADTTSSAPGDEFDAMSDDIINVMVDDSLGVVYNSYGFESSYDDKERFCVYLDFYNESGETTYYGDLFDLEAFQGGVELDYTYLTSDVAYDTSTKVQTGHSATVCVSFYLRDTSEVTLELHYYGNWTDELVDVMSITFDN